MILSPTLGQPLQLQDHTQEYVSVKKENCILEECLIITRKE